MCVCMFGGGGGAQGLPFEICLVDGVVSTVDRERRSTSSHGS